MLYPAYESLGNAVRGVVTHFLVAILIDRGVYRRIDGRADRFRIIILSGRRGVLLTHAVKLRFCVRACLGAGQSCVPDRRKTWLQKRMLIIAPQGGGGRGADTCLRNADVLHRLVHVSPLSIGTHAARTLIASYGDADTRSANVTEPYLSLRSFPRSFAGKLQIGRFSWERAGDDGSANPRAIFPSA